MKLFFMMIKMLIAVVKMLLVVKVSLYIYMCVYNLVSGESSTAFNIVFVVLDKCLLFYLSRFTKIYFRAQESSLFFMY